MNLLRSYAGRTFHNNVKEITRNRLEREELKMAIISTRLVAVGCGYGPEDNDPGGRHWEEYWRLEFYPFHFGLPQEDAIFVSYKRNKFHEDALENRLLDCAEEDKWDKVVRTVENMFRTHKYYFFTIENSVPVASSSPVIDLPIQLPIVSYNSLASAYNDLLPGQTDCVVRWKHKSYIYKSAQFPNSAISLAQELRNYVLLKKSLWIAELGPKVRRQRRNEGYLIRYYPNGALTRHFDEDEDTKRRWITEIATALVEFEEMGFFHKDLKCGNVVVDDDDSIRITIDFENRGGTKNWAHPDDLQTFLHSFDLSPFPCTPLEGTKRITPYNLVSCPQHIPTSSTSFPPNLNLHLSQFEGQNIHGGAFPIATPRDQKPLAQKRQYAVYNFGKTVWELFVGGTPTDEAELRKTPQWVQELVGGCCVEERYKSMREVLASLKSLREAS
jgi:serine/threonine protein kinase